MRKILFLVVLVLGGIVVISSFSELQGIVETLKKANIRYLIAAILLQLLWFVGVAAVYKSLYRLMAIKEGLPHLALLASAVNFINIVAPSAGVGGMAVFIDDAGRRGHPHGRVVAAAALFVFLDYISFLVVLALGLLVLFRRNTLNSAEIIPTLILLAVVIFSGWLLYTGARSPSALGTTLARISKGINRALKVVLRRDYFHEERSYIFAAEISDGLSILRNEYRGLLVPMSYLGLNRFIQICILMMAFLSFDVSFTGGTLIGGYAVSYLLLIVSPTPSGVGIVEGAFPVVLASLGVPLAQAIIVTFTFRAVTFWLPLGLGAITFRFINSSKQVTGLPE
jgi:glycosyltransferase 2 family protein